MSNDLGQPRIVAHDKRWNRTGQWTNELACSCGWTYAPTADGPTFRDHVAEQSAILAAQQIGWYERTGHCGQCGEPGVFCLCRQPCGCHELHEVGSGLVADPLDTFAVVTVGDDQGELFGSGGTQ